VNPRTGKHQRHSFALLQSGYLPGCLFKREESNLTRIRAQVTSPAKSPSSIFYSRRLLKLRESILAEDNFQRGISSTSRWRINRCSCWTPRGARQVPTMNTFGAFVEGNRSGSGLYPQKTTLPGRFGVVRITPLLTTFMRGRPQSFELFQSFAGGYAYTDPSF
jgi:hypothetical protein